MAQRPIPLCLTLSPGPWLITLSTSFYSSRWTTFGEVFNRSSDILKVKPRGLLQLLGPKVLTSAAPGQLYRLLDTLWTVTAAGNTQRYIQRLLVYVVLQKASEAVLLTITITSICFCTQILRSRNNDNCRRSGIRKSVFYPLGIISSTLGGKSSCKEPRNLQLPLDQKEFSHTVPEASGFIEVSKEEEEKDTKGVWVASEKAVVIGARGRSKVPENLEVVGAVGIDNNLSLEAAGVEVPPHVPRLQFSHLLGGVRALVLGERRINITVNAFLESEGGPVGGGLRRR
ncbi:hypothetical protein SK128_011347, partial [Halocaridina rubra]